MIKKIIKRDRREMPFNVEKIANAIFKAAKAAGGNDIEESRELSYLVCEYIEGTLQTDSPSVEQVQDCVEKILIENGHAKTAKNYILYRAERNRIREMDSKIMKIYEDLTFKSAEDNDLKRENANIDGDTAMGTMLKYGSEGAKRFYELYVLDPIHAKEHAEGNIHIHDMDFLTLTTTCCQIDIVELFKNGFSTGHGYLREPNDIQSYSALACIAIQANQNDQHGGQSIPNFDYGMSNGVRKSYIKFFNQNIGRALEILADNPDGQYVSKEMYKDILDKYNVKPVLANDNDYCARIKDELLQYVDEKTADKIVAFALKNAKTEIDRSTFQAMEALIHNLNTMHSRAGAQVPFSSLNYGTDTSEEGRLVVKNILLATEQGLGNGETPIFPIQIFKVKEGVSFNKEDKNYDLFKLSCRVSAKRLFPNFSFLDAPFNLQYYKEGDYNSEVAYMGCRTRVMSNIHDKEHETTAGRGNLSFTSLNLPRLGIESKGDLDVFFASLDYYLELISEQLMHRYKIQARKLVRNYPFLMGQGVWLGSDKLSMDDEVGEVLKHGTLSVGFIGLAETLKALTGKHHGESEESQALGLKIIGYMREFLDKKAIETNFNYSLIATPAEGLSGRFVRIDQNRFGKIEGITDRDFYTNSFHIPVYYNITAFEKIKIEAPYHALTNAGHISYIELDGDPCDNLDAFESVVRYMKESGIGYGSVNHPVDRDPICGYTGVIQNECPQCGRTEQDGGPKFDRIRRITGYLVGTVSNFNNAKRAEEAARVKHL